MDQRGEHRDGHPDRGVEKTFERRPPQVSRARGRAGDEEYERCNEDEGERVIAHHHRLDGELQNSQQENEQQGDPAERGDRQVDARADQRAHGAMQPAPDRVASAGDEPDAVPEKLVTGVVDARNCGRSFSTCRPSFARA